MRSRAPSQVTILTEIAAPNQTLAPMIVPPDGGWGWVIVLTGFIASTITDGISYSFYLFCIPMVDEFKIDPSEIPFMSALFTGFYFIGGILACSIGNYCGFRIVMVMGATVASTSFACGYLFNEIIYYHFVIGFIGGIAAGFISLAGCLPPGFYFDKKRSIAMGIVTCGSGVGAIIMPQITQIFMDKFGWRLTFIFHAGLFSIMILMGCLIRPLRPVMVVIKPGSWTSVIGAGRESSFVDFSIFRIPVHDTTSIGASTAVRSIGTTLGATVTHPTISRIVQETDVISIRVPDTTKLSTVAKLHNMAQIRDTHQLQASASVLMAAINIEHELNTETTKSIPWYKCCCCRSRRGSLPERPLLRTDLYYTGSLMRLEEYTTTGKDLEYHMHVTKVPTYFEVMQDVTRTYTSWCCRNILHGIKTLLDYTLLKSPTFDCLALCGFACYVAFFLPFLYGKLQLEKIGEGGYATTLVSMIGLGNMMGRISSGLIVTQCPRFGARTTVSFTNMVAGLTVIICTLHDNIIFKFGCMMLYGFSVGIFTPLRSIIIVDFLGLEKLTSATGMMILFQGCGSFSGAPLAEAALAITGNDHTPFYVCGASLIFASIILWPMRRFHRWETKRKARKTERQQKQ